MTTVSDEIVHSELPEGWFEKESSSRPGKFYYISPTGVTTWARPVRKDNSRVYNWILEIVVVFGNGKLGIELRDIGLETNSLVLPFPEFQAIVGDLPKLSKGKAGPAEIYNWSVKPPLRLTGGMRVTKLDDDSVAGLSYSQVIEKLKKSKRPLKISFCDVSLGEMGLEEIERRKSSPKKSIPPSVPISFNSQLSSTYQAMLVLTELHQATSSMELQKVFDSNKILRQKVSIVSSDMERLKNTYLKNQKEQKKIVKEKEDLSALRKHLKLQAEGTMESKEAVRTTTLVEKNTELVKDIEKLTSGNKKLKTKRDTAQAQYDAFMGSTDVSILSGEELEMIGISHVGRLLKSSVAVQTAALQECLANLLDEHKEPKVRSIASSSLSSKQMQLETKIKEHRDQLHTLTENTVAAKKKSDSNLVASLLERRVRLKAELRRFQDELRALNVPRETSSVQSSSQSSSHRTANSLTVPFPTLKGILSKTSSAIEGSLVNNARNMRGARERYCELNPPGILTYYKRRGEAPRGQLDLRDSSLEVVSDMQQGLEFILSTSSRQLRFIASSREHLMEWVTGIRTVHRMWKSSINAVSHNNNSSSIQKERSDSNPNRGTIGF